MGNSASVREKALERRIQAVNELTGREDCLGFLPLKHRLLNVALIGALGSLATAFVVLRLFDSPLVIGLVQLVHIASLGLLVYLSTEARVIVRFEDTNGLMKARVGGKPLRMISIYPVPLIAPITPSRLGPVLKLNEGKFYMHRKIQPFFIHLTTSPSIRNQTTGKLELLDP